MNGLFVSRFRAQNRLCSLQTCRYGLFRLFSCLWGAVELHMKEPSMKLWCAYKRSIMKFSQNRKKLLLPDWTTAQIMMPVTGLLLRLWILWQDQPATKRNLKTKSCHFGSRFWCQWWGKSWGEHVEMTSDGPGFGCGTFGPAGELTFRATVDWIIDSEGVGSAGEPSNVS